MSEEITESEDNFDALLGEELNETTPEPEETNAEWKTGLKEEYSKNFEKYNDINGFAKSYVDMQKGFNERVKIPDEESTNEDWNNFYTKSGRPDKWEEYGYERSEDMPSEIPFGEDQAQDALQMAHELGLSKRQTTQFMKRMEASATDSWERQTENKDYQAKEQMDETLRQIKDEYGGGYKSFLSNSNWALKEFADESTVKWIHDNAGNNLGLLKMFEKIAKSTKPAEGVETSGGVPSDDSAMEEVRSIRSDPNHKYYEAYKDSMNPRHAEAHQHVRKLYAMTSR